MKHIMLAVAFAVTVAIQAPAEPAVREPAPKLGPSEQQAFILALAYAEIAEPELDYHLWHFAVTARDPVTNVQTVTVCGSPKPGSKWHCAAVTFRVLVAPDGTMSEPPWNFHCRW